MNAVTWHVTYRNERDWLLELCGELLARFDYKDDAIREGRWRAGACEAGGKLAQVIVHRPDGTIERELRFGGESRKAG